MPSKVRGEITFPFPNVNDVPLKFESGQLTL